MIFTIVVIVAVLLLLFLNIRIVASATPAKTDVSTGRCTTLNRTRIRIIGTSAMLYHPAFISSIAIVHN